jgi:DNA-directed RNA polymerase omega subunit
MAEKKENEKVVNNLVDSKYRKILIAAARSKQIQRGARPRVNLPNAKPTRVALAEIERNLVAFDVTPKE